MKKLLIGLVLSGFFFSGCANIDVDVGKLPFSAWGKSKDTTEKKEDARRTEKAVAVHEPS